MVLPDYMYIMWDFFAQNTIKQTGMRVLQVIKSWMFLYSWNRSFKVSYHASICPCAWPSVLFIFFPCLECHKSQM